MFVSSWLWNQERKVYVITIDVYRDLEISSLFLESYDIDSRNCFSLCV